MKYSWPSLLIHLCAGAAAPLRGQTVEPPASTRPAIEFLIRQLDDQRFSVRDRATEALAALGPEALDELVHRYRSEPCHEQKLRLRYAIESVISVRKDELPLAEVFDRAGAPRLMLITCGGEFDYTASSYSDNIVVVAVPVAS